jgi:NAD(P)H-dependent flavin oxidoreductase YrpB (nitropropane dioxygenase family)
MIEASFTKLVNASAPIQAAAMPGISTSELVAAVADAGAVGMLSATLLSADGLAAELERTSNATDGVFGVNFLIPFLDPACVPVAARGARIVEFFYGEPQPPMIDEVHSHGALASWQVGSLAEAVAAVRTGCDLVIVQGTEASRGEAQTG